MITFKIGETKSDIIKILTDILKTAKDKGVVIYAEENECVSYESFYRQPGSKSSRTGNK